MPVAEVLQIGKANARKIKCQNGTFEFTHEGSLPYSVA